MNGGFVELLVLFALNLLLGWTVVGWVAALVWALTKDPAASAGGGGPPA